MTFYRSGAQKSNVYKRDAFVTSWRFHNRAWQPQRDDRLSETSGTLWIHRGALTNQRCSLATGCGIMILIQYQDWSHRCITMTSHGCHTFSNHWQLDLVQQFVQANNKENIKAPYYRPFVTGPFVSIIHRWFVDSLTKSQSCGKYVCGMKSSYTLWFPMSNMFILHCYGTREF